MKQKNRELWCCLQTLQTLDLNYDSFNSFHLNKKKYSLRPGFKKKEIINLLEVAKYIVYIASIHTTESQLIEEQALLSKYLYRFRYFYNFSESKYLKRNDMKQDKYSALKLNMIALEHLFLLTKY